MAEFGTESCYNTLATKYNAVCKLDDTHVVVAWVNDVSQYSGYAKVGLINGNTVTWGAESCFYGGQETGNISVSALDSTHFVVGYSYYYSATKIGLVSGTTISSYGAENVFCNERRDSSVSALDSTHFVVAYADVYNEYGCARIGLVSGTTITYGAENVFLTAKTRNLSVSALDSSHFVVGYENYDSPTQCFCIVGLVSGTTISSYGAENMFVVGSSYSSVSALDSTHFVVGYKKSLNGYARIGLVSGTIITYGTENMFNNDYTHYISVSALDSAHFVIGWMGRVISGYLGYTTVGTVSGTTISYGSHNLFNNDLTGYVAAAALNSTDYIVVYQDGGSSNYGYGRVWGPAGAGAIIPIFMHHYRQMRE